MRSDISPSKVLLVVNILRTLVKCLIINIHIDRMQQKQNVNFNGTDGL